MAPGRSHLQGMTRLMLPDDVGQVRSGRRR